MFSLYLTLRAFRLRDENKALGKWATWRWEQSANTIHTGLYLNTDPETAVNVDDLSHTPRLYACFLWCLRSSSPDLIFPALWEASRGSHTPPETDNNTHKHRAWLEQECACTLKLTWLRFTCCISKTCNKCLWVCPSYSLVVNDILVLSGHPGCPFPGLLVQTVLLCRPRLRLQLTTLISHTQPHRDTPQQQANTQKYSVKNNSSRCAIRRGC